MKQIALDQLQAAIAILKNASQGISLASTESTDHCIKAAIENINAAIYSETPSTSRKFDLYKFTHDDMNLRPIMCGVFHNDGFKVASDTHILVAVKETYDDALEGHILDKTGQDIFGRYPRWKDILPKKEEGEGYPIDTALVYELIKTQKVEKKAAGKWGNSRKAFVKVGDTFFRAEDMVKLATFMDAYGTNELRIIARNRAAACFAPDGSVAIIMPRTTAEDYYNSPILSEVFEKERDKYLWYEAA